MRRFGRLALATLVVSGALLGACSDPSSEADVGDVPPVSTKPDDRGVGTGAGGEPQSAIPAPAEPNTSEADRAITQRVRERIGDQEGLSMDAQEVTIRTRDGVVTLEGPVASSEEKTRLAALAADAIGVKRIDNQLAVAP